MEVARRSLERYATCWRKLIACLALLLAALGPDPEAAPNLGTPPSQSHKDFVAQTEKELPEILEKFKQGDELAFWPLWDSLNRAGVPKDWATTQRQTLVDAVEELRVAEKAGLTKERWSPVYESLIQRTEAEGFQELGGLAELASAHAMQAIERDRGDRLLAWYEALPPAKQDFYFYSLKNRNRLLHRLRDSVNPFQADPDTLADEPRLSLIASFLAHPFFQRIQPFNNKTFVQLIRLKCLSPAELFAHREAMVSAHVRQGMAYLDLARIYREDGQFDEALDQIEIGLTLHNHQGNRLGCYLIERTIIYREAGKMKEARETFDTIPFDLLDRHNTGLIGEIEGTL